MELDQLRKKVSLLEDAMISMSALLIQNQMVIAELRLSAAESDLFKKTQPAYDEMSRRMNKVLDKLSEAIDVGR